MNEEAEKLLEATTQGCHDDFEAFFTMAYTLAEALVFPISAVWLNDPITVTGINVERSSLCQGIQANVAHKETVLPLADLQFPQAPPENKKWLNTFALFESER